MRTITASDMGKKGAKKRLSKMSKKDKSEHARKMANARWKQHENNKTNS